VTHVLGGHGEQYWEIIDRYEKKLTRYIYRLSWLEDETVQDVLQEVFMKAYKNLASFRIDGVFSSWIYRIAHNECVTYLRKQKPSTSMDLEYEDGTRLVDNLASDIDIEGIHEKEELKNQVQAWIMGLSVKYKQVIVLHFLEEKSYEEISEILRIPIGTVGTLMNRAKKQLSQSLTHVI